MLSSSLLVLAFLAISLPLSSALMCYECTNVTGVSHKDCANPATQTCSQGYNSCILAVYHVGSPFGLQIQMRRNCSIDCNKEADCAQMNKTASGQVKKCEVHCCMGEKCNLEFPPRPTTGSSVVTTVTPGNGSVVTAESTPGSRSKTEPSSAQTLFSCVVLMVVALVFGNIM